MTPSPQPNEFGFGGGVTFESVSALVRSTAGGLEKFAERIGALAKAGHAAGPDR